MMADARLMRDSTRQAELLEGPPPVARMRAADEPAPVAAHDVPLQLALAGVALHDARPFLAANGHAYVRALLQQRLRHHPAARPVLATWPVPAATGDAAMRAAQELAARLPAGTETMVIAQGAYAGQHDGADVLVLAGVRALYPAAPIVARHRAECAQVPTAPATSTTRTTTVA